MSFRHLCALGCHYTIPGTRRIFMSKALRTALSLVVSLVLLSTLTIAQTAGKKANQNRKEHHSVFAKMAFWRHRKDADKKAKSHSSSKHAHPKSAQVKPAPGKQVVRDRKSVVEGKREDTR